MTVRTNPLMGSALKNEFVMSCLQSEAELMDEAVWFHHAMFASAPSSEFIRNYIDANLECGDLHSEIGEVVIIRRLAKKKANVVVVEAALRRRKPRHLLTRKMTLVAYIAECDAAHLNVYNHSVSTFMFWGLFPFWGFRALFRLLCGKLLVVRYGI